MLHFAAVGQPVRRTNVHRSIAPMLMAFGALSTTLAAQSGDSVKTVPSNHAIGFGYFATLGSNWQIEAVEVGYVDRLSHGLAAFSIAGRVGPFIDESAVLGGSRVMVLASTWSTRTSIRRIAQTWRWER